MPKRGIVRSLRRLRKHEKSIIEHAKQLKVSLDSGADLKRLQDAVKKERKIRVDPLALRRILQMSERQASEVGSSISA